MATVHDVLAEIARVLDGKEWDADTPDEIARIVRAQGFEIRDPSEVDEN